MKYVFAYETNVTFFSSFNVNLHKWLNSRSTLR